MVSQKQGEEAIVSNFNENESQSNMESKGIDGDKEDDQPMFSVKSFFWHGGSVWDAWFSCASNQVSLFLFIWRVTLVLNNILLQLCS